MQRVLRGQMYEVVETPLAEGPRLLAPADIRALGAAVPRAAGATAEAWLAGVLDKLEQVRRRRRRRPSRCPGHFKKTSRDLTPRKLHATPTSAPASRPPPRDC